MGKPAARVLDMTAHGGMIAGPGSATVLIGKMPAARMTDMHVCPMCNGPAPHSGGPAIGPGCPTVLIGKMPAVCVGDMATCAGPPATVLPPGCPTVLIGSSAGGAAGGGAGGASGGGQSSMSSMSRLQPIQGSEAFPIDIQIQLAQAARYQTPAETALLVKLIEDSLRHGSGGGAQEDHGHELTIADIVEILTAIEREESYEAARHFASYLDYSTLTSMAMSGTDGNDPNQMPTRFMLLWGADDNRLQQVDAHPDNFEGAAEHRITVANLRKALRLLGHEIAESGAFDDDVLRGLAAYLCTAWPRVIVPDETHVVAPGETLSSIAGMYGLASWKYLYEVNRDNVGGNPDLLTAGAELEIPAWDHTSGEEKIEAKGAHTFPYVGGARYAYPWVPYSVTLVNRAGQLYKEKNGAGEVSDTFDEEKEFVISDGDSGTELARGRISQSDGIKLLAPDAHAKCLVVDGKRYG